MSLLSNLAVDDASFTDGNPRAIRRGFQFLGYNPAVPSGTLDDVWSQGGERIWPTVAATATVASSNAADSSAGIGVRTVFLAGVDANLDFASEVITMTGTTPVISVNEYFRLNFIRALSTGRLNDSNTNPNVGTITAAIGGNVQVSIQDDLQGISSGQQNGLFATVARGNNVYIHSMTVTAVEKKGVALNVFVRSAVDPGGGNFNPRIQLSKVFAVEGTLEVVYETPLFVPEFADVWVTAENLGAGTTEIEVELAAKIIRNA